MNIVDRHKFTNIIDFYHKYGLLIKYESLVSCTADEAYMLSDHIKAINYLNYVYIHLPNYESKSDLLFQINIEK